MTFRFGFESEYHLLRQRESKGPEDSGLEPVDEAPYGSTSGFDAMAAGVPWLQGNRQQQQQHLGSLHATLP